MEGKNTSEERRLVVKTRCRGHLDQFLDDSKGAKVDVIFLFRRGVEGKNASEERRSVVETGGIDGVQKRWCRDGLLKNERPIIQFLSVFSPGLSPSRYLSKFFVASRQHLDMDDGGHDQLSLFALRLVSHHKRVSLLRRILSFHKTRNPKDYINLRSSSKLFHSVL